MNEEKTSVSVKDDENSDKKVDKIILQLKKF